MSLIPSNAELAQQVAEALRRTRETPEEHFQRLIRLGWINAEGEVTTLLGGEAQPEPAYAPADSSDAA